MVDALKDRDGWPLRPGALVRAYPLGLDGCRPPPEWLGEVVAIEPSERWGGIAKVREDRSGRVRDVPVGRLRVRYISPEEREERERQRAIREGRPRRRT